MVLDSGAVSVFSGVVPDVVLRIEVTVYDVMSQAVVRYNEV